MMTERQSASQAGLTQNQVLEIGSNSIPKVGVVSGHGTVAMGEYVCPTANPDFQVIQRLLRV